jgi:hypothetical protein
LLARVKIGALRVSGEAGPGERGAGPLPRRLCGAALAQAAGRLQPAGGGRDRLS